MKSSSQKKNETVVNEYSRSCFVYDQECDNLSQQLDAEIDQLKADYDNCTIAFYSVTSTATGLSEEKLEEMFSTPVGEDLEIWKKIDEAFEKEEVLNALLPMLEAQRDYCHIMTLKFTKFIKIVSERLRACNAALDNAGDMYSDTVLEVIKKDREEFTKILFNARQQSEQAMEDYHAALKGLEEKFQIQAPMVN